MNGNPETEGIAVAGGADELGTVGKSPRAFKDAMRGLSGGVGTAGCGVLLLRGIGGMALGGGVGCWRAAVAFMSPANVF